MLRQDDLVVIGKLSNSKRLLVKLLIDVTDLHATCLLPSSIDFDFTEMLLAKLKTSLRHTGEYVSWGLW